MDRPIAFPIGLNPMGVAGNRVMDQLGFPNTDPQFPSAPPPARAGMGMREGVLNAMQAMQGGGRPMALPIGLNPMGIVGNKMLDQLGAPNTDPSYPSAPPQARMMMAMRQRVLDASTSMYEVKRGDNLTRIAREAGTSVQNLISMNPEIKNPDRIFPGQKIRVPNDTSSGMREQYRSNPYLAQNEYQPAIDPAEDAIEPSGVLESLLGGAKLPAAMLGGLVGMAKMAPTALPRAGRMAIGGGSNVMPYGGNMGAARAAAYQPMQEVMANRAAQQTIQGGLEGSSMQMNPLRLMQMLQQGIRR